MPLAPNKDSVESRHAQWDVFLERWPLERLATMTLREYSQAGDSDSFVYWLEVKTEGLGSVWGGSAFKFGIYSRKTPGEPKRDGDRYYSDSYAWYSRYGDTPEAAFEKVRQNIVRVAHAARRGDLEAIDDVGIGQVIKWKLAFLYQDRGRPTVLPILKLEYLQIAQGTKHRKASVLQRELMTKAGGQDVLAYGDAVWATVEPQIKTELTVDEAKAFFDQSERFTPVKSAVQKMAGYTSASGLQIALALDNRKTTLYLTAGDWLPTVQSQLLKINHYSPSRPRSSSLAANAPALSEGHAVVRVVVPNMEALIALCDAYDIQDEPGPDPHLSSSNPIDADAMPPLNQILFGPPGTGKTYETINAALEVLSPEFLAAHGNDRAALKAHFDALVVAGDIRFVTFHQSFSYEDFVEGIRAEKTDDGQLSYSIVDGVFKVICLAARGEEHSSPSVVPASPLFQVGETFGTGYQVIHSSIDMVELKKPKGNEVAFSLRMLKTLAEYVRQGKITIEDIGEERLLIDKLPGTSLEPNIVHGYRNFLPALVRRVLDGGDAPKAATGASLRPTAKVLIIDEINRGNVSRILGELITLIESSKRAGSPEALEVVLPYSKSRFSVPSNLYLIGTMNTADRSLAGLDLALRRRFNFKEMPPRPELLEGVEIDGVNVGALLRVINERIELLLDRDHCIGHAYFMPLVESPTLDGLARVFRAKILPLLQEYFFEDWQRIQWVFNDHRKSIEHRFVHKPTSNMVQLFGEGVGIAEQNQRWTINELAFSQAEAYIGVINHLGVANA
ncbi:conserved hypothetical protein [Cupriavidus taiwanensis]|uniref:ATPase dynein-related AAA domain-containing protein n=1 Tax=Cupriavidus taiwanensis TaxID=164546 RepID=A0A375B7W2_9BURK|nr:AAA family ATPase [Cupriavidus taiwanensis]SOY39737.1 conserved hypothetical protein [Cupriavidus taiwanensis]